MMKSSAKWTFLSVSAISVMTAAAFGFGCTVTSGTVNDDGGTVKPTDSGGDVTDASASVCTGNNQQNAIFSATCQACAEQHCCTELKGCYNQVPGNIPDGDGGDSGTPYASCDDYTTCIGQAQSQADVAICDAATTKGISDSYDVLETCVTTSCKTECGL